MYDFTKQVAQDDADVSMLLEAGMEVHSFEPSSQMIAEIQDADVFIYNSPEMETWVPDVLASIDTSDMVVICASEAITLLEYEGEAHAHEHESDVGRGGGWTYPYCRSARLVGPCAGADGGIRRSRKDWQKQMQIMLKII